MGKRESITLSFCEKCGEKVFSRDKSCSGCGTLPYQEDRDFRNENNIPLESFFDDWSEELMEKLNFWCDIETEIHYCKDCGKPKEEISKYDDDYVDEETGEVITNNTHPCNPNSPLFE
jgi:ribosomal protein L37E